MEILTWHSMRRSFVVIAFSGALFFQQANAASLCTDLPASALQVLDIQAAPQEPVVVSAEDLDRPSQREELMSRHARMVSMSDFVAWFDIMHRIVPRDDGSFCDAPTLVRMGFGASRRYVFIERDTAANPCMRQRLLDHETAHNAALNSVVDRFVDQNRAVFQAGMIALKQTPASSAELAKARWEAGIRVILSESKRQLLTRLRVASAEVDAAFSTIEALDTSCRGKLY